MNKRGFTLIELLVVIAIIAILASILFPVFASAREKARQTTCSSNEKQIGLAFMEYVQDYDEMWPYNFSAAAANTAQGSPCDSLPLGDYDPSCKNPSFDYPGQIYAAIDPYTKNTNIYICPDRVYQYPTVASQSFGPPGYAWQGQPGNTTYPMPMAGYVFNYWSFYGTNESKVTNPDEAVVMFEGFQNWDDNFPDIGASSGSWGGWCGTWRENYYNPWLSAKEGYSYDYIDANAVAPTGIADADGGCDTGFDNGAQWHTNMMQNMLFSDGHVKFTDWNSIKWQGLLACLAPGQASYDAPVSTIYAGPELKCGVY